MSDTPTYDLAVIGGGAADRYDDRVGGSERIVLNLAGRKGGCGRRRNARPSGWEVQPLPPEGREDE